MSSLVNRIAFASHWRILDVRQYIAPVLLFASGRSPGTCTWPSLDEGIHTTAESDRPGPPEAALVGVTGVLLRSGVLYRRSIADPSKANSVQSQANSTGVIDFLPVLQARIHSA